MLTDNELNEKKALDLAIRLIGAKTNGLLYSFGRVFQYSDEPKFFQYYAQLRDQKEKDKPDSVSASGFSFFSQKTAVLKCLFEAIERLALKSIKKENIIFSAGPNLNKPYIRPTDFASFNKNQRQSNLYFELKDDSYFGWILGKELPSLREVYVPAQLVYLSYIRRKDESFIRLPISTGAASGTAYSAALYRGICEVIERDAFMISYLNKLEGRPINLHNTKNKQIKKILKTAADYNLKVDMFDTTTDLGVYTFLTTVRDKTGIASALSTGLKCGLNPIDVAIGSLQEAFHPRSWLRGEMEKIKGEKEDLMEPIDLSSRGLLWSKLSTLRNLKFLFNSKKLSKNIDDYLNYSSGSIKKDLGNVLQTLTNKNYKSYFVDITPTCSKISNSEIKVVMVLIPKLQPMHLDERYPYLGGTRLFSVPLELGYLKNRNRQYSLNKFPHPFL